MSKEWHDQLTLEEMADYSPGYIFEKYFLDPSGRSDPKKRTGVLVVPIPRTQQICHGKDCSKRLARSRAGGTRFLRPASPSTPGGTGQP